MKFYYKKLNLFHGYKIKSEMNVIDLFITTSRDMFFYYVYIKIKFACQITWTTL